MPGIRRYEPKIYGVICDTCGFATEVTRLAGHDYEADPKRSEYCTHGNAIDGFFIDDCPNWARSLKSGYRLDADGNLMERPTK
jgi:hypothetical protein